MDRRDEGNGDTGIPHAFCRYIDLLQGGEQHGVAAVLCDVELWRDSQPKELHAVDRECKRFRFVSRFVRIELVLSPLL